MPTRPKPSHDNTEGSNHFDPLPRLVDRLHRPCCCATADSPRRAGRVMPAPRDSNWRDDRQHEIVAAGARIAVRARSATATGGRCSCRSPEWRDRRRLKTARRAARISSATSERGRARYGAENLESRDGRKHEMRAALRAVFERQAPVGRSNGPQLRSSIVFVRQAPAA